MRTHARKKIQPTTYARCVHQKSRRCLLAVSCLFVSVSLEPSFGMKFRPAFKTVTEKTTKGKQSLRQERFSMFSLHVLLHTHSATCFYYSLLPDFSFCFNHWIVISFHFLFTPQEKLSFIDYKILAPEYLRSLLRYTADW